MQRHTHPGVPVAPPAGLRLTCTDVPRYAFTARVMVGGLFAEEPPAVTQPQFIHRWHASHLTSATLFAAFQQAAGPSHVGLLFPLCPWVPPCPLFPPVPTDVTSPRRRHDPSSEHSPSSHTRSPGMHDTDTTTVRVTVSVTVGVPPVTEYEM